MATYRYVFGDITTGRILTEIPVYGGYITDKLNDVGYMQGSFNLDETGLDNDLLVQSTIPGACWNGVYRDDVLVWAGFITSRTYQAQSKSIQFYSKTLEGQLDLLLVCPSRFFSTTFQKISIDQGQIFFDLLERLDKVAPALIEWNIASSDPTLGPTTGVLKTIDIDYYDFKTYRDVVDELANGDDGFDWRIRPIIEPNPSDGEIRLRHAEILFGYPSFGLTTEPSSLIFEFPGNVLNYYRTDNLSGAGTLIYGLGDGQGQDMLISEVSAGAPSSFLTIHKTVPLKSITDQAILTSRTAQEATKRKPPRTQYKVTLRADAEPNFGSWNLGDPVELIIQDSMHPLGIDVPARISEYALTPSSGENPEEVSIVFVGDFE